MMASLVFFPHKHCSLPTTLEMGELNNYRLLHHFKSSDLPGWAAFGATTFLNSSPRAYIFKISRYATVTSTEMDDLSY